MQLNIHPPHLNDATATLFNMSAWAATEPLMESYKDGCVRFGQNIVVDDGAFLNSSWRNNAVDSGFVRSGETSQWCQSARIQLAELPCEVAASTGSSQTWTYVNMKCFNMLDWHEEWNSIIFVALCWRQLPLMRMLFLNSQQTPIRKRPPFKLNWTDMNDRKTTKNTFKDEWKIISSGDYKNHRKFA